MALPAWLSPWERRVLAVLSAAAGKIPEVEELVLFGSRARGEGGELSDLDVLVLLEAPEGVRARRVLEELLDLLFEALPPADVFRVDLIVTGRREVPPALAREVVRDGISFWRRETHGRENRGCES